MTADRRERRAFARWSGPESGELTIGGETRPCRVINFSAGGVRLAAVGSPPLAPGDEVVLGLRGLPPLAAVVVWASDEGVGLEFRDRPQYVFR